MEDKDRIKKRVAQMTEMKIQEVHQLLDAFELRFLQCPDPTINLNTLQEVVTSLRADVDNILEMRGPDPETTPVQLAKDTLLAALFTGPTTSSKPRECDKRHRSNYTTDGEDALLRKKERTDLEAASRGLFD